MRGIITENTGLLDRAPAQESQHTIDDVGQSSPLGATVYSNGVNFSVLFRSASRTELLLFDREDDADPSHIIPIGPYTNRTYHYWHVFVPEARAGQIYAYRAYGPFEPTNGFRFDPDKALLDPYGRGVVVPKNYSRESARNPGARSVVVLFSRIQD